jgi:hypothetical protein
MKKLSAIIILASLCAGLSGAAAAHDRFGISIAIAPPVTYVAPAPVYYYPPPQALYYPPQVVYAPAPWGIRSYGYYPAWNGRHFAHRR